MNKPDTQYRDLMSRIMREGMLVVSQQSRIDEAIDPKAEALMVVGHQMRFNLQEGFPIITERDLCAKSAKGGPSIFTLALAELFAFLHGAQTLEEMQQHGCGWWAEWVTPKKCAKRGLPPGHLGPGSYGPAWRGFPTAEGEQFDQITGIMRQIQEQPWLRTHFISPWIPQYTIRLEGRQQRVVVAPCHGWLHFLIDPDLKHLRLHHFQRSADVPVGLPANLIQYAALALMMGDILGYTPVELVYTISDAHIYRGQFEDVEDMLATEPQPLPTVTINTKVGDLFDFRPEHFTIEGYQPQLGRRKIWTGI